MFISKTPDRLMIGQRPPPEMCALASIRSFYLDRIKHRNALTLPPIMWAGR